MIGAGLGEQGVEVQTLPPIAPVSTWRSAINQMHYNPILKTFWIRRKIFQQRFKNTAVGYLQSFMSIFMLRGSVHLGEVPGQY